MKVPRYRVKSWRQENRGVKGEKSLGVDSVLFEVRGGRQNTTGGFPADLSAAAKYYTHGANSVVTLGTDSPPNGYSEDPGKERKRSLEDVNLDQRSSFPMCAFLHTDL